MQKSEFNQVGFDETLVRLCRKQRQSIRLFGCREDNGKSEPKTIDLRASAHIKRLPDGSVVSIYTPPVVIELDDKIIMDNPF